VHSLPEPVRYAIKNKIVGGIASQLSKAILLHNITNRW
jgi:hypothetical protein